MSNNGQANYAHLSDADMVAALKSLYRVAPGECLITKLHEEYKKAMQSNGVEHKDCEQIIGQCLSAPDPLLSFAAFYSTWLNGNVSFAPMFGVEETKLGMGITLFAIKPFRVQMFLFKAGAHIPPHSHPDVESYEMYVAGDMELTKQIPDPVITKSNIRMAPQTQRAFVTPDSHGICKSNGGMIRIPAGCVHGGWINARSYDKELDECFANPRSGGCFLSIQYWRNSWEDSSVAVNWKGVDGTTHG